MAVKPVPDGYETITPYFVVNGAEKFIEFAKRAFGAKEVFRANMPDGSIMHVELQIGSSKIMLGQASERWKPETCALYLYVPDVDSVYKKAVEAGAKSIMEPADMFYGDRSSGVLDPFGNHWWIATHIKDVSPEELERHIHDHTKQPTT
ncbi:MAG: VOC family protein [Acidobacteria bacterium]|nr:MAG: VOC family protein [Acidobacteriota bacterium]